MRRLKNDIPDVFSNPTASPSLTQEKKILQDANKSWWEKSPMRYDWNSEISHESFTKPFYEEIDRRFFMNASRYMPWKKIPFDALIDFESLHDRNVLEIGVGNGSHAQLLAQYSGKFTGIDLTDYAVKSTTERMKCFGLKADIIRMDAEKLDFDDNSFDFVWSWGVIHHSSDTEGILKEINRVLVPGGRAAIMVYHKSIWFYYILGVLYRGILQGDLFKTRSLHKTVQRYTDGAIARYYTIKEWKAITEGLFSTESVRIFGTKSEILPLPSGRIKNFMENAVPDVFTRILTNTFHMGSFLVTVLKKAEDGLS